MTTCKNCGLPYMDHQLPDMNDPNSADLFGFEVKAACPIGTTKWEANPSYGQF